MGVSGEDGLVWEVINHHGSIHVIPKSDSKEHFFLECGCNPKYEGGVYVHNSYDERELTEELPRC